MGNALRKSSVLRLTSLVLLGLQATSAFARSFEIDRTMNGRKTLDFIGAGNILGSLPEGTIGDVIPDGKNSPSKQRLKSGNYAYHVRISRVGHDDHPARAGEVKKGEIVWIYYHTNPEHRLVHALNAQGEVTTTATEAAKVKTRKPLKIKVHPGQTAENLRPANCVVCGGSGGPAIHVPPTPLDVVEPSLAETLDVRVEEVLFVIKSARAKNPKIAVKTVQNLYRVRPRVKSIEELDRLIASEIVKQCDAQNPPVPFSRELAIIQHESEFYPMAHSGKDANGLAQIRHGSYDVVNNIHRSVWLLSYLDRLFHGNERNILLGYVSGEGAAQKIIDGEASMSDDAREYIYGSRKKNTVGVPSTENEYAIAMQEHTASGMVAQNTAP